MEANGHIGWTAEELVHTHSRVVQPPAAAEPGAPSIFDAPPPGGLVMGIAGTSDLDSLIEAQSFEIQVIATIDVRQQRWLMHIVDAPSMANSLTSEVLRPETIIIVRRAPPELPAEVAPPTDDADDGGGVNERPGGTARITYYYCERGSNRAGWGDGGGWCGAMRSGKTVYAGAAACSATNLGQRFRIVGDPTERTYTCEDTGGGVRGNHRDIWFRNSDEAMRWYAAVGTHAEIVIVE